MKAPVTPRLGRLLSIRDAARYLGISEERARALVARQQIAAVHHPSGRVSGVYEADCDAYLDRARSMVAVLAPSPSVLDADVRALPGATKFH